MLCIYIIIYKYASVKGKEDEEVRVQRRAEA